MLVTTILQSITTKSPNTIASTTATTLPRNLHKVLTQQELKLINSVTNRITTTSKVNQSSSLSSSSTSLPGNLFTVEKNLITGCWRKPRISARQQAVLRRSQLISESYGFGKLPLIGLPSPKLTHPSMRNKLPKLPKDQRLKPYRTAAIQGKLAAMDTLIEEWRKTKAAEKAKAKSGLPF